MGKDHDKAAAPRDRELIQLRIPRREAERIRHALVIACATLRATSQVQIQAIDKSRSRQAPTTHFAARARVKRNAQKIPPRIQLVKTPMAPCGAPSRRAGERSHKTGRAWRNTTTPR